MELRRLRERISAALKSAGRFARGALALPYARLYIATALVLTAVFTVLGFPFDVLIRSELQKMEQRGLRSVIVGEIDFNVIGDSYIDSLILGTGTESEISMKDVRFDIAINPVTTLVNKTLKGEIGVQDFRYADDSASFSCLLNSEFRLAADPASGVPRDGFLNIEIQNVSLKGITIKEFTIPAIRFTSIAMQSEIKKSEIHITKLEGAGPDIRGTVRGSIALAPYVRNSTLNLVIDIDTQSKLIQDYRMLLGGLAKNDEGLLRLTVSGSLQAPVVGVPGGEKGREQ
ncbi:MAG TPA: type II secretion system protein GspN [Spirochaetota bacterium]|nr:type II secretion system protein GspN [Spirochaetota bacterium]